MKCLDYAEETWTLMQADERRLEAFQMWIWKRMESISWMNTVTNKKIPRKVNEDKQIRNVRQQRQH